MSNWPIEKLKGKINIKHGFPFKGEFFSDQKSEFIVLTPGNFYETGGFKRQPGKEKFYTGEFSEEYIHSKGDVIVAMTEQAAGLLGSCARVPESGLYLHNQRLGLIKTNPQYLLKDYVYYLFRTNTVREQIRLSSSGSKVKHTSPERIYDVEVPLPEVEEQQKIVNFLDVIENKLELNNRVNAELEAMAKTLYEYWFVQFDFPDANGKPYKTSGGNMVFNATLKRNIPAGWRASNILSLADLFGGGTPTKTNHEYWDGSIPFFTPTDSDKNIYSLNTQDSITELGLKKSSTRLFEKNTIFITARGSVGRLALNAVPMAMNQSCYALRAKQGTSFAFLYFLTKELIHHLEVKATGSVFNSIVSNDIEYTNLALPDDIGLIDKYAKKIEPIFTTIELLTKENHQLTTLRNMLLPLLMNGQVTV